MIGTNPHGQPIGDHLGEWAPPEAPAEMSTQGETVALEPLSWDVHGEGLWKRLSTAPEKTWTYMTFGPFPDVESFRGTIEAMVADPGLSPYAVVVEGEPLGFGCYLRVRPAEGVIEIGSIVLGPDLQRTAAATEALYLMIRRVFDLGYRRCEWKCDSLNEPSRQAATRLGFTYEGIFRQATHYKGRNRDTAWYAIVDREWPALDDALRRWLSPDNFDGDGRQLLTLREMRSET